MALETCRGSWHLMLVESCSVGDRHHRRRHRIHHQGLYHHRVDRILRLQLRAQYSPDHGPLLRLPLRMNQHTPG